MKSIIIGAGTYGEVYLSYLREAGVEVIGFLDDNATMHGQVVRGIPVLGGSDLLHTLRHSHDVQAVYCPIGNNRVRVRMLTMAQDLGYDTPNYIHPSALISPDATLGKGVYIFPQTIILPYAKIGDYVMIAQRTSISHHTHLRTGVFLSAGCTIGASITVDEYAYCGMSATVMTGVKRIGEDTLIGAGAVVIRDVPNRAVVAGVPAKILKYKE